jgi:alpha-mannosidase
VEQGPVRATIEVKKKFGLARFTQRIALYDGLPRIDFGLAIHWNGKNRMVKVSFPLAVSSPEATYEIPYGAVRRPSKGEEHVAQNWVDVSTNGYGVSLLNDSRYGYDVTPNMVRLSVLRSPTEPVFSTDEKGLHEVTYALYPHGGSWQESRVVQQGCELNNPMLALLDAPHGGDLPAAYSFVRVDSHTVIMTVLKKAEDSDDLILRGYESQGNACATRVTLAPTLSVDAVHATDLLENSQREIPVDANGFTADTPAYSIETYKLIRDL